jgi:hypothetical protein
VEKIRKTPRLKKKMKFNETVTASSSLGASNVHISDKLRVTSGICFSNLTNCNFYFLNKIVHINDDKMS